jgi:hypothetical protein
VQVNKAPNLGKEDRRRRVHFSAFQKRDDRCSDFYLGSHPGGRSPKRLLYENQCHYEAPGGVEPEAKADATRGVRRPASIRVRHRLR